MTSKSGVKSSKRIVAGVLPNAWLTLSMLVKAGYLRPVQRHDADAVTAAIARLKQDLRKGGGEDDEGPTA